MVEVNCETDFVARSEKFRELAHELALQIAASAPRYIKVEEIQADVLEHEANIARVRAKEEGKPENVAEQIVQGRIEKFKDEVVPTRQAYIRDESITVEKLILQTVGAIGENIIVRLLPAMGTGRTSGKLVGMTNLRVGHFYKPHLS